MVQEAAARVGQEETRASCSPMNRDGPAVLPRAGTVQMEGTAYALSHLKGCQKGEEDSGESHLYNTDSDMAAD